MLACSLTCRAWLPACRYHLFDKIVLVPRDVLAFFEYVDSSSSDIGAAVRQLVVRRESVSSMMVMGTPRIAHVTLKKLSSHFQRLQTLTLLETFWSLLTFDTKDLLTHLVTVKDLRLHRAHFETVRRAVELICAFPALESVSFRDWAVLVQGTELNSFLATTPKLAQKYPLRVHLDCLNLDRSKTILYLIEWLMAQDPSPSVQLDILRLGPLQDLSLLASPCIHKLMRTNNLPLVQLQIKAPQFPYSSQELDGTCFFYNDKRKSLHSVYRLPATSRGRY